MKLQPFKLERYFSKYEFEVPHLLCCSDCEPLSLNGLLKYADQKSIDLWHNLKLGYTDSRGHPILREEIAKLYKTIDPENVLVITPEEGIFIAMNVLLKAGDEVIVTFPGYQSLHEVARSLGCRIIPWMPSEKENWRFDVDYIKSMITDKTRLIIINFPHNPTGALLSQSDFNEILAVAQDHGITIFSDEMYRMLEFNSTDRLISAADAYDRSITLSGMSKSYGLAGLRIGWLINKDHGILEQLAAYRDYTTICSSAPSEILAIMALRAGGKIIERNIKIIKNNINYLNDFFDAHSQRFLWILPRAGSVGLVKLLFTLDPEKFCTHLREESGVLLLPLTVYDYKGPYIRIGFGRINMPQALDKLRVYMDGYGD